MPKDYPRTRRVADQIQRELSEIIRLELKDPRVGMVTLTGVEVTPDYSHAKVFFTTMGNEAQRDATERAFARASGFMRTELAHRLRLRVTPDLIFTFDESVERGARLSKLIDDAVGGAAPKPTNGSE